MVPDVDYSNGQQPLKSMLPDLSLTVIACEVKDWNLELSPWKGVSIDGRILGGGGSGSFWVDGWSDYAKTHALRKKASIYLSLGGKEDKTDNPLMATVGTRTKELERKMFRTVCEKKQECKECCERSVTFHVIRQ